MTHSRAQMLARIIIRVKLGIASLEEREKLLAWLDESEENRQLHKDIIRGKCIAERLRLEDEINETTDFKQVYGKVYKRLTTRGEKTEVVYSDRYRRSCCRMSVWCGISYFFIMVGKRKRQDRGKYCFYRAT